MRARILGILLIALACFGVGLATAGDYRGGFPVVQVISGERSTTWAVSKAGAMLPGADASYSIGSSSYRPANLSVVNATMKGVKLEVGVTTANITLTTASPAMLIVTNATAVATLANATTAGNGTVQHIVNAAGSGNVSIASASLIGGDASINATVNATRSVVANNGTWLILK